MKKYSGNHSVNSKKKHGVIRHSGLVICSILFILCSCMYFGMFRVSAKEIDQQRTSDAIEICYTSRLIEPGDSLWSIAEETITDRYGSVSEYVEALKVMNHLDSDTIHAGQYLMIAYENYKWYQYTPYVLIYTLLESEEDCYLPSRNSALNSSR